MRPSNYRYLLSVRSFGGLKMRFFKGNDTLGWRTYSNFSSFWPPKKAILVMSLNPPLEATGFMSTTTGHFGIIKMWFFRGHDSLGTMVSFFRCVTLRILKAWKWYLKCHETLGTRLCDYRWTFWTFLCPENTILTSSETLRVHCFEWKPFKQLLKFHETLDLSCIHKASFRSFGGLKMRFFMVQETLGWRIHGFRWQIFVFLAATQNDSCRDVKCQPLLDILAK